MKNVVVLVPLFLVACSAAGEDAPPVELVQLADVNLRTELRTVDLRPLTPEAEDSVRAAVSRWEAAGVAPSQFRIVAEGGTAVMYRDTCIPRRNGDCISGAYTSKGLEVWKDSEYDLNYVWTHEVGHVPGLPDGLPGIMGGTDQINDETLRAMCVLMYCDRWIPETYASSESPSSGSVTFNFRF